MVKQYSIIALHYDNKLYWEYDFASGLIIV